MKILTIIASIFFIVMSAHAMMTVHENSNWFFVDFFNVIVWTLILSVTIFKD